MSNLGQNNQSNGRPGLFEVLIQDLTLMNRYQWINLSMHDQKRNQRRMPDLLGWAGKHRRGYMCRHLTAKQ